MVSILMKFVHACWNSRVRSLIVSFNLFYRYNSLFNPSHIEFEVETKKVDNSWYDSRPSHGNTIFFHGQSLGYSGNVASVCVREYHWFFQGMLVLDQISDICLWHLYFLPIAYIPSRSNISKFLQARLRKFLSTKFIRKGKVHTGEMGIRKWGDN